MRKLFMKKDKVDERLKVLLKLIRENYIIPRHEEPSILKLEANYWLVLFFATIITGAYFIKIYEHNKNFLVLFDGYDGGVYDCEIVIATFLSALTCAVHYALTSDFVRKIFMGRSRFLFFITIVSSAILSALYLLGIYSYLVHNTYLDHFFQVSFSIQIKRPKIFLNFITI